MIYFLFKVMFFNVNGEKVPCFHVLPQGGAVVMHKNSATCEMAEECFVDWVDKDKGHIIFSFCSQ